jgi:hypothetical protein
MDDRSDDRVACATYTHARRHPMVLGKIGDWTPPFQLTMAQVGVLLGTLLVETQTWRYWGPKLNPTVAILVFIAIPAALAWAVRKARVEGRSLARAVAGWFAYLARPRAGRAGGRGYRPARPSVWSIHRVYVADGPVFFEPDPVTPVETRSQPQQPGRSAPRRSETVQARGRV